MSLADDVRAGLASSVDSGLIGRALVEWHATRDPGLAAALDRLTGAALEDFRAPKAPGKDDFHAAWMKLARASPDAVAVGWLASTLTTKLPLKMGLGRYGSPEYIERKYRGWFDRLSALSALPDDPRVAAALTHALSEAPFLVTDAHEAIRVYRPACALLLRLRDVRASAPLAELLERPRASRASTRAAFAVLFPEVIAGLASLPREAAEPFRPFLVDAKASREDQHAMLREIHASLDDDRPRRVYADWLIDQGDPRGEFINAQLRGEPGHAALRKHQDEWLGPLASVLKSIAFRRGFLDSAAVAPNSRAAPKLWEDAVRDERLQTLRSLDKDKGSASHFHALAFSPQALNLRSLTVVDGQTVDRLRHNSSLRLTRLALLRAIPAEALCELLSFETTRTVCELHVEFRYGDDSTEFIHRVARDAAVQNVRQFSTTDFRSVELLRRLLEERRFDRLTLGHPTSQARITLTEGEIDDRIGHTTNDALAHFPAVPRWKIRLSKSVWADPTEAIERARAEGKSIELL